MRENVIRLGGLVVEPDELRASMNGQYLALTLFQFKLLALLARNPNRVLHYGELATTLTHTHTSRNQLAVLISRLRRKLAEHTPYTIVAVNKRGYALSSVPPQLPSEKADYPMVADPPRKQV